MGIEEIKALRNHIELLEANIEDISEALGDEILVLTNERDDLKKEVARYQRMLYEMTGLTDWMRAGYSSDEYSALVAQFEGADAPGGE